MKSIHFSITPYLLLCTVLLVSGCSAFSWAKCDLKQNDCLRQTYSRPSRYWPKPTVDAGVKWRELEAISLQTAPTLSAKETLGAMLFNEKQLSSDGTVSCLSCHQPVYAFADPNEVSQGVLNRHGRRNSISLLHLSEPQAFYFWDGRASTLEQQVLMPMADPNEMNMDLSQVPDRLHKAGYARYFQTAFGRDIDLQAVADALSAYLRTIQPQPTRFDRFLLGQADALSDSELRGLHLFRTKARCLNCHFGKMMTDGLMHNLNQTLVGKPWQDLGQYEHTGKPADWGKFKTPSLRNLSASKPWFHHGLFVNLRGIVAMYNIGMIAGVPKNAPPEARLNHLDPLIKPLGLSPQEQQDLTRFLKAL